MRQKVLPAINKWCARISVSFKENKNGIEEKMAIGREKYRRKLLNIWNGKKACNNNFNLLHTDGT